MTDWKEVARQVIARRRAVGVQWPQRDVAELLAEIDSNQDAYALSGEDRLEVRMSNLERQTALYGSERSAK